MTAQTGRLFGQLNPWTDDDLARIHRASLRILERTGVLVEHDGVLDILEATDAVGGSGSSRRAVSGRSGGRADAERAGQLGPCCTGSGRSPGISP